MLLHFPLRLRPAITALWAIDEAMGDTVVHATQPALAAIKLAWWREALIRLDTDPAPPEPRLRAVASHILPQSISGADVASIEQGWSAVMEERPTAEAVGQRGKALLAIEARLLRVDDPLLQQSGALFAISDAMRRGLGRFEEDRLELIRQLRRQRVSRRARPVTLAARLAARPIAEPEGTPGRALALLTHRIHGVITGGD